MTAVQVAADEDVQAGAGATAGLFAELQGHAVGGDDVVASDDAFLLDTQDLLELMIVVAIIGILAAIAIPVYSGVTRKARVAKANADLNVLASAVSVCAAFANALPSTLTDLNSAVTNNLGQTAGPFIVRTPTPPPGWGSYAYTPVATAGTFTIANSGDGTSVTAP